MDGCKVAIGDRVYDILLGNGSVVAVGTDSFTMRAGGNIITVIGDGKVGACRRVYWENPIVMIPSKQDSAFKIASNAMKTVYAGLKTDASWSEKDDGSDAE